MNSTGHLPLMPLLRRPAPARFALWDLGFRPFFLLASLFSVFSVLLWVAQYSGLLSHAYLRGPVWHAHEMLFGYTIAVIAGFLLTAVRNWTSQPTATGAPLMALAALWVCGRVLVLTPFETAAAVVNAAFPVAVAVAIGIPLVRARNVRNYFFVGLLLLMGVLVLVVHLSLREGSDLSPRLGLVARTRCRALHHGGHGGPRHTDVHQQRRSRRGRDAPCLWWKSLHWALCCCCSPQTFCNCIRWPSPRWRWWARQRMAFAFICGGHGGPWLLHWCGYSMPHTHGS